MAKRRVGNPLFDTQEPEQFVNLQEPSFLDGFKDEIPDVEALEGIGALGGQPPPEMDQEMPQSLEVQDARQLPLPPKEEPSFLDSIGQYFTKGLQTVGDARYPEQDDLMPEDYSGLENLAEVEEPAQALPEMNPPSMSKAPEQQMRMGSPMASPDQADKDALEGVGYLAEGEAELAQADQEIENEPQDPEFAEKVISGQPPIKPEVTEEEVYQRAETESEPVAGAIEAAKNNPYVMKELARQNKIEAIPDDLMQYAQDWENSYTKRMEDLSEREKGLLKKLETGNLSDFDKIAIGLAIAVPVIMGLMYGGSAFALSTAGVLQGISGFKNQESKDKIKAKEGLSEITKDKLKLTEEGLKIRQEIMDKLPNKEVRKYLENRNFEKFGEDIGISAEDEKGVLWINKNKIKDDEDVKKMRERTKEAEELLGGVSNFNEALDGVQDVVLSIQDQDPGLWDVLKKNFKVLETTSPDQISNSSLGDILSLISKIPGVSDKSIEIEILGDDGKITKVNALDALQQSIKALQNDYNTAVLKGSRLTENVMKHWSGIMFDPTSISQFLSSGVGGWMENSKNLRNIMNRKVQEELVGYGFIRQPLQEAYPVTERKILRPVSAVNRDIARNPDAYKSKVK